jgi:DNA-binding beta-propeller fold protein YncE
MSAAGRRDGHRGSRISRRVLALLVVAAAGLALPGSASAATWLPVQTLSAAGAQAIEPQVALDAEGNALAIWHRAGFVQMRFRPRGGSFGPAQDLSLPGGNALRGQVAFDAAGNALTAWGRTGAAPDFVQARSHSAGGSLGALQTVATGDLLTDPGVAVDSAGNALVVWSRRLMPGDDLRVETRFRPAGGAFQAIQTHSSPGLNASREQVAMDPAGNALVVWQRPTFGDNRIQARFRPAGGGFGATQNLSVANVHAERPRVAFAPDGDALVTWELESLVQARSRPAGGSFGVTQDISPAAVNAGPADIAVDPAGNAVFVWGTSGATDRVQARPRSAGGGLGPVQNLSAAGVDIESPQVAVDAVGNAVAVWVRNDGANDRVEAAFRPAGGSFEPAQTLSAAGQDADEPQVAMDPAGDAFAVWHRSDGSFDRVQARFMQGAQAGGGAPSNDFSFGKLKRNKKRGTGKQTVIVPGSGELELAKTKRLKPANKRAEAAGKVKLRIKPRRNAKRRLIRNGKAKLKANVTYTPDGGDPNTKSKKLKLKKRV